MGGSSLTSPYGSVPVTLTNSPRRSQALSNGLIQAPKSVPPAPPTSSHLKTASLKRVKNISLHNHVGPMATSTPQGDNGYGHTSSSHRNGVNHIYQSPYELKSMSSSIASTTNGGVSSTPNHYRSPSRLLLEQQLLQQQLHQQSHQNPHPNGHHLYPAPSSSKSANMTGDMNGKQYDSNIRSHVSLKSGIYGQIGDSRDSSTLNSSKLVHTLDMNHKRPELLLHQLVLVKKDKKKKKWSESFDSDPQKRFQFIQSTLIMTNVVALFLGVIGLIVAGFVDPIYKINTVGGQLCLVSVYVILTSLTGLYGARRESVTLLVAYGAMILAALLCRSIFYFVASFVSSNSGISIALSMTSALLEVILILFAFGLAAEVRLRKIEKKNNQEKTSPSKNNNQNVLTKKSSSQTASTASPVLTSSSAASTSSSSNHNPSTTSPSSTPSPKVTTNGTSKQQHHSTTNNKKRSEVIEIISKAQVEV